VRQDEQIDPCQSRDNPVRKNQRLAGIGTMKMHGSVWTDDDLKRLAAIVTAGGTPLRASAALRRSIAACRNQAKKIGTPFTPMQITRRNIKAKCADAEKTLAR
jgi:hypothetical protein